jgi:hypothetical protein
MASRRGPPKHMVATVAYGCACRAKGTSEGTPEQACALARSGPPPVRGAGRAHLVFGLYCEEAQDETRLLPELIKAGGVVWAQVGWGAAAPRGVG